jgi:hypothetical protein
MILGSFVVGPIASQSWATVPVQEIKGEYPIPREEFVSGIRDGTIEWRVYGRIQYETGYWFDGETGYCLLFQPASKRLNSPPAFHPCQNENYIYAK